MLGFVRRDAQQQLRDLARSGQVERLDLTARELLQCRMLLPLCASTLEAVRRSPKVLSCVGEARRIEADACRHVVLLGGLVPLGGFEPMVGNACCGGPMLLQEGPYRLVQYLRNRTRHGSQCRLDDQIMGECLVADHLGRLQLAPRTDEV